MSDKVKKKRFKNPFAKKPKEPAIKEIGMPYDYQQNFHVGFDTKTGQFQVCFISLLLSIFFFTNNMY